MRTRSTTTALFAAFCTSAAASLPSTTTMLTPIARQRHPAIWAVGNLRALSRSTEKRLPRNDAFLTARASHACIFTRALFSFISVSCGCANLIPAHRDHFARTFGVFPGRNRKSCLRSELAEFNAPCIPLFQPIHDGLCPCRSDLLRDPNLPVFTFRV